MFVGVVRQTVYPVADQGLGLGLEAGEAEVGTAFVHGDHRLGGLGAQLDRVIPVLGRQVRQETGVLSEQAIASGR